jgi:DNA polymerase-3 subunit delta
MKDWLPVFVESKGKRIDIDAINRLIDLIGADLTKIHNELDKIFATISDDFIRVKHIDEHVGFNREYNIFELQTALGSRNFNRSVQIAHQMSATMEKGEMMRNVVVLQKYFSNVLLLHGMNAADKFEIAKVLGVNPYFVDEYMKAKSHFNLLDLENVIKQLTYLDLRLKGINRGAASDGDLLIETVVKILHR